MDVFSHGAIKEGATLGKRGGSRGTRRPPKRRIQRPGGRGTRLSLEPDRRAIHMRGVRGFRCAGTEHADKNRRGRTEPGNPIWRVARRERRSKGQTVCQRK